METGTKAAALDIFYSYSHDDEDLRNELDQHLSVLQRSGLIQQWHDRKIGAGSEWAGQISEHLERADVILLLVSSSFLASNYCWDVELKRALERHGAGKATVIPVILRPVDWHAAPFAHLQCLPTDARPVTSWANRDEAFRIVAEGIRAVVEGRLARPLRSSPATQPRVLDAAVPQRMPVGETGQLFAMIRQASSDGLRAVLQIEQVESITPDSVRSKPFVISFPAGPGGQRQPAIVTVSLDSPDFDPPQQSTMIAVPPDGDSEHCVFLLKPLKAGDLLLKLEVVHLGVAVATRTLKTNGASAGTAASPAWVLASMPLTIIGYVGPLRPLPAIGRLDVARPKQVVTPEPQAVVGGNTGIKDVTQAIPLLNSPMELAPAPAPAAPEPASPPRTARPLMVLPEPSPDRRMRPWLAMAATAIVGVGLIAIGYSLRQGGPSQSTEVPQAPPPIAIPPQAKLAIKAPAGAQVYVDGELQPNPLPPEILLPPGPHNIRVLVRDLLDRMTTVELKAGERTEVSLH